MTGLRVAAAGIALALAASAAWWVRGTAADAEISTLKAQHAQQITDATTATLVAEGRERAKEQQHLLAVAGIADAGHARETSLRARGTELDRVAGRLRDHVGRLAARTGAPGTDTPVAAPGEAVAGPGMVLADLYGGADREAVELAQAFDAARGRGLTCEASYDAVTAPARGQD